MKRARAPTVLLLSQVFAVHVLLNSSATHAGNFDRRLNQHLRHNLKEKHNTLLPQTAALNSNHSSRNPRTRIRGGAEDDDASSGNSYFDEITAIKNSGNSNGDSQAENSESPSTATTSQSRLTLLQKSGWLLQPFKDRAAKVPGSQNLVDTFSKGVTATQTHSTKILSTVGPALVAVFCQEPLSLKRLYALALLGSSVGFYMFLYFISIGYALGVALPVSVSLFLVKPNVYSYTFWHSALVGIWGLRLATFLVWREYVNWPALHRKVLMVNRMQAPGIVEKIVGWLLYSFLYVCLLSPCWFRLSASMQEGFVPNVIMSRLTLSLQLVGLLLESVADWQKSRFKASFNGADGTGSSNRYEWCNTGLFSLSTHPNYLGEWLFWLGTFLGGLSHGLLQTVFSTVGFAFLSWVIFGAVKSLSERQTEKYVGNTQFDKFMATHSVWGPALWRRTRPPSFAQSVSVSEGVRMVSEPAAAAR